MALHRRMRMEGENFTEITEATVMIETRWETTNEIDQ